MPDSFYEYRVVAHDGQPVSLAYGGQPTTSKRWAQKACDDHNLPTANAKRGPYRVQVRSVTVTPWVNLNTTGQSEP